MTLGKEVAKVEMSVTDLRILAGDFAKSGYFADAKDVFQAVVKIQAGFELGFGPVYSMTKIYIVKGKVMVSAEALGAMVKRSGRYDYQVKKLDDDECVLEFTDTGKAVYTSKFTMIDAKRADLCKQDSGWAKWPRAMLMSKALSQGSRIVCPHVIAGVYTPADFGVETDAEGMPTVVVETIPARIAEIQRKHIFAVAHDKGMTDDQLHDLISKRFGCHHVTDLTGIQASKLIEELESTPEGSKAPEQVPAPAVAEQGQPASKDTKETTQLEGIDIDRVLESLKKMPGWKVGAWLHEKYPTAEGHSVRQVVQTLTVDQRKEFAREVQSRLEMS